MAIQIKTTKSPNTKTKDSNTKSNAVASLSIEKQYIKNLTFTGERKPNSIKLDDQPKINIKIDVNSNLSNENPHEVIIYLNCQAVDNESKIYEAEFNYAGLFNIENIPEAKIQALLHVECARILFPFARRILADLIIDAGFFPVLLDPVDFLALYKIKLERATKDRTADTKIN